MASPASMPNERAAAENDAGEPASRIATVGAPEAGEGAAGNDRAGDANNIGQSDSAAVSDGGVKEGAAVVDDSAASGQLDAEHQQHQPQSGDQPPTPHPRLPQDQIATPPRRGGDNVSTALAQGADPEYRNKGSSDTRYASRASNYTSAPATVLDTDSDRNDFIRGAPSDDKVGEGAMEDGGSAMGKLKQWFGGASNEQQERGDNDYHSFSSPNPSNHGSEDVFAQEGGSPSKKTGGAKEKDPRSNALDRNGYDESLLDDEEKGEGEVQLSDAPPDGAWEKAGASSRPIPGTEEEERVMRESSFFYGAAGPHRARRINPRAMARAIRTGARRRWTERRYRRRLRQSQFRPYPHGREGATTEPGPEEFTYELTSEHRNAFLAAHTALNEKLANEYGRNRHAIRKQFGYNYEHDLDYDLEMAEQEGGEGPEEIRADLTKSSLAIRGGLIRLPADNVRLVSDSHLQPGILSIETRDVSGGMVGYENYGNANRYGNINGVGVMRPIPESEEATPGQRRLSESKESVTVGEQLQRHELAYVLTVDEHIYQRMVREMGDAYRVPCGMYYCCHATENGDHVGIGIAVMIMMVVFALFIVAIIRWPEW